MSGTSESNLLSVSISLLYDGMYVQDDIYDFDYRLLIKSDNTLSSSQIERIKNLNSGRDTIYVTGRTRKAMLSKKPSDLEVDSLKELEESTGYAEVKDTTFEILSKISNDKVIDQDSLQSVSNDLSRKLDETSPTVIMALINALAPVDEYLQRHCVNVSMLNGMLGKWMGLSKAEVDTLVLIGLLHDCGKALIPHSILNEHRRLTIVEFEVIKTHPIRSYELLSDFPEDIRRAALHHHEKMNGTGYPNKLEGENIPIESRVTTISDIYDALVAQRAYKEPRSPFSVLALLKRIAGNELDRRLVNIFIQNMPKELMDKQVVLSNGSVAYVRDIDMDDIEYPVVAQFGEEIKTNANLYCTSMY
jgi:HD-GYP domain-containing protein (c-di-GMP phosphodiesterase class II)